MTARTTSTPAATMRGTTPSSSAGDISHASAAAHSGRRARSPTEPMRGERGRPGVAARRGARASASGRASARGHDPDAARQHLPRLAPRVEARQALRATSRRPRRPRAARRRRRPRTSRCRAHAATGDDVDPDAGLAQGPQDARVVGAGRAGADQHQRRAPLRRVGGRRGGGGDGVLTRCRGSW